MDALFALDPRARSVFSPEALNDSVADLLELGGGFLAAYETPEGDITVARHGPSGWAPPAEVTAGYRRREGGRWERPRLIVGADGVAWLFYLSAERRMVFAHRDLGGTWGPRLDVPGIHYAEPFNDGSVYEERAPLASYDVTLDPNGNTLCVALQSLDAFWTFPPPQTWPPDTFASPGNDPALEPGNNENFPLHATRELPLGAPSARPGASVLFVDDLEVAAVEGLDWSPEVAEKHDANPVLHAGENTWDSMSINCCGASVLHYDDAFHWWYTAFEYPGTGAVPKPEKLAENWQKFGKACYARSDDGIHWDKPDLGLVEYMGSRRNNIVPNLSRSPLIVKEDLEEDPQRRFKSVQQFEFDSWTPRRMRYHTSPDGFRWTTRPAERRFPDLVPWYFGWNSFFRDDQEKNPARRYKAYGYMGLGPGRRASGMAWSRDCVVWNGYGENPVVHPRQVSGDYIHDLVVWQESGLYLGLLQVSDAWHNEEFELVVSRDGYRFSLVQDGHKFIARGEEGAWDNGSIAGCSMPLRHGDEMRFYYAGNNCPGDDETPEMAKWNEPGKQIIHGGLARVGLGRYAGFQPAPGAETATLTTIPIAPTEELTLPPLSVNARVHPGGGVTAALLDAETLAPLAGYAAEDCMPMETDAVAGPIRWKNHPPTPPDRPFRIRFYVTGAQSKLFGFSWESSE
jgi:hypothetical protein